MARIVHVLGDGRAGGGTTVVFDLCRLLKQQGEAMTIVTQSGSRLAREAGAGGLSVVELDFSHRYRTPVVAVALGRALRQIRPAVVHAHGARAAAPVALLPRALAPRFIYTVHGFHYRRKPPPVRQLAWLSEAFCIARAGCTVFVSDADFAHARSAGLLSHSREQRVIKNAVSVEVDTLADRPKVYDIGFLGRLHFQKNPLILAEILKALRPLRPSLCVIGGGALAGELRSRLAAAGLSDQVTLCGECDRATALRTLSLCRTQVLPSRWEGHPLALIEAMHLGLPVVASDVSGTAEIVAEGETGYLVAAEDADAYADRLRRLLADPVLREKMGQEARRRAARDYSLDRMVRAHLEVYTAAPAEAYRLIPGAPT